MMSHVRYGGNIPFAAVDDSRYGPAEAEFVDAESAEEGPHPYHQQLWRIQTADPPQLLVETSGLEPPTSLAWSSRYCLVRY